MRRMIGVFATAGIVGSVLWAPAIALAQPAAMSLSYGGANSTVVPQPDGAPSIFIQAGGIVYNSWYDDGNWPSYPIAAYTPPMGPPSGSLPYGSATSRAVAILQPDGSPSIFFQGLGGSLWNCWYVNGTWDSAEIASGGVASTPAAILQANGALSLFVVGQNHSLLNYWYIPASASWGEGTVASPGSAFQVPAAVTTAGGPQVFVEGPDHSLWWYDYISALGMWFGQPVATLQGGGFAFSAPSVVLQTDGTASIFVLGPHNSLVNYWFPPAPVADTAWSNSQGDLGYCWDGATVPAGLCLLLSGGHPAVQRCTFRIRPRTEELVAQLLVHPRSAGMGFGHSRATGVRRQPGLRCHGPD